MFPLQSVLLPGESLPLRIFEPRYVEMVRDVLNAPDPIFGVVLIARGREVGGGDVRHDIGTAARILDCESVGTDRFALRCVGVHRIRVRQWLPDDPYPRAQIESWPDEPGGPAIPLGTIDEIQSRIETLIRRTAKTRGIRLPHRWSISRRKPSGDPSNRLYTLASQAPIGEADRLAVLSAPTAAARVNALNEAVETVEAMLEFGRPGR